MADRSPKRGYRRDETAFFHRQSTHRAIDTVAHAEDLVIYVGAGATIDAGGPSWRELVRKLADKTALAKEKILTGTEKQTLGDRLSPLEASTALATYYSQLRDDPARARTSLLDRVRAHVYPDATWNAGKLNEVLAKFLILRTAAAVTEGLPWRTLVVTTNYDTFLEDELLKQLELLNEALQGEDEELDLEVQAITLRRGRPARFKDIEAIEREASVTGVIPIIYLHGRLPEAGALVEPLAVTETDYNALRPHVGAVLQWALSNRTTLIIGSSLGDPPLLSALQDSTSQTVKRFALLPMPAISSMATGEPDEDELLALRKHQSARMEQFNVKVLAPDFYSQVAQFVQECIVAVRAVAPPESYSSRDDLRYGGRLTAWWDLWYDRRFKDLRFREHTRTELHKLVQRIVSEDLIDTAKLSSYHGEVLKLEIWVRWHPDDTNRCLALWASSDSTWHEERSLRMADLSLTSEYAAVRTYVAGRPQLSYAMSEGSSAESVDSPHVDRWKTFLSVPIHLADGVGVLPVGVITLASRAGEGDSAIWASGAKTMADLVANLLLTGLDALGPERWSDPSAAKLRHTASAAKKSVGGRPTGASGVRRRRPRAE